MSQGGIEIHLSLPHERNCGGHRIGAHLWCSTKPAQLHLFLVSFIISLCLPPCVSFLLSANVSFSHNHFQEGCSSCGFMAQLGEMASPKYSRGLFTLCFVDEIQPWKFTCTTSGKNSLQHRSITFITHLFPPAVFWGLPVIFSCLGIIPGNGADKQSSLCGDTWTATSTGWHALLGCRCVRECDEDVDSGEASGDDGGLSWGLSVQRVPWHCLRLCSMNSRMSARGKREWHWPQVSRSWSPLRGSPWATPSLEESWESSSGRTPDSGSAI